MQVQVYGGTGQVYGGSGQYYAPSATSSISNSRVVIPRNNRVYYYQPYASQYYTNAESSNYDGAYNNNDANQYGVNNNRQNNVNGGQSKTRRYQIRRPAIKKEFYDVEEKVIIRPVGSALIELDPPISKTLKTDGSTAYPSRVKKHI